MPGHGESAIQVVRSHTEYVVDWPILLESFEYQQIIAGFSFPDDDSIFSACLRKSGLPYRFQNVRPVRAVSGAG